MSWNKNAKDRRNGMKKRQEKRREGRKEKDGETKGEGSSSECRSPLWLLS